jgi:hypothetical protein
MDTVISRYEIHMSDPEGIDEWVIVQATYLSVKYTREKENFQNRDDISVPTTN